jgi:saccharopine dehydrogenase-like NADP-dependent oxidoreductase
MKTILLLGAGMSSSSLIRYLLAESEKFDWKLNVVDQNTALVLKKTANHPRAKALSFNALDAKARRTSIHEADIVISMLPARFHPEVAKDCIELKTHLITPSYVSPEMKVLADEAIRAGVIIMNEIGVDPGIDHMSAMQIIHKIQGLGAEMLSFKSFCGGLIAPESDNNPWHYKFTWSPRNVILAGQGGAAAFTQNNDFKYIPYAQLFKRTERFIIGNHGEFEGYANRDSFAYKKAYGLSTIPTIYRGTLRRPHFCEGWNVFIELGMTDDTYVVSESHKMSPRKFINSFLPYHQSRSVEDKFFDFLGSERKHLFPQFEWLGFFDDVLIIGKDKATPAQILENLLAGKLSLSPEDKDMLVMHHEFEYSLNGKKKQVISSMICLGEDQTYTAMSNTVGLPVGIMAKLILNGAYDKPGISIPIDKDVYEPILKELQSFDISFHEIENDL